KTFILSEEREIEAVLFVMCINLYTLPLHSTISSNAAKFMSIWYKLMGERATQKRERERETCGCAKLNDGQGGNETGREGRRFVNTVQANCFFFSHVVCATCKSSKYRSRSWLQSPHSPAPPSHSSPRLPRHIL